MYVLIMCLHEHGAIRFFLKVTTAACLVYTSFAVFPVSTIYKWTASCWNLSIDFDKASSDRLRFLANLPVRGIA